MCVTYLDKLIEMWSRFGFVLVCDSTNSGVYQMQSDIYIHQCSDPTTIMSYNPKINTIMSSGRFVNRSVEVIGVYTRVSARVRVGYKYEPVVACFFLDGQNNKEFYTFQTQNQRRNKLDNRSQVV